MLIDFVPRKIHKVHFIDGGRRVWEVATCDGLHNLHNEVCYVLVISNVYVTCSSVTVSIPSLISEIFNLAEYCTTSVKCIHLLLIDDV